MKKRIFCYVGSPKGENSVTFGLIKRLLSLLDYHDICYSQIFSPSNLRIEKCRGCECCFKYGRCELDKMDNFDRIKDEISSSDIIILGTPVYAGSVSSYLKEFIERLSMWLHIFKLAGKCGVIVVTSSGNSLCETVHYLKRIMQGWGIVCIHTLAIPVNNYMDIENTETNAEIMKCAEYIRNFLYGSEKPKSNYYLEQYYQTLKKMYLPIRGSEHYEVKYWNDNGFFEYNSFQELLESRYMEK